MPVIRAKLKSWSSFKRISKGEDFFKRHTLPRQITEVGYALNSGFQFFWWSGTPMKHSKD